MVLLGFSRRFLRHLRLHKVPARRRRPAGGTARGTCHSHARSRPGWNSESSCSPLLQISPRLYLILSLRSFFGTCPAVFSSFWFYWSLCRVGIGGQVCTSGCGFRAPAGAGGLSRDPLDVITACWFAYFSSSGPQTLPIESVGFRPVTSSSTASSTHPIQITAEYTFWAAWGPRAFT